MLSIFLEELLAANRPPLFGEIFLFKEGGNAVDFS